MSLRTILKPVLLALALLPMSAVVLASPRGHGAPPTERPRAGGNQHDNPRQHDNSDALSDSVRRIERSTRGQVLSAERVPFDGRDVNRIKTVDDRGRVRVYMDDPRARPEQPDPPPAE
jgi:hypothetical protein